MQSSTPAARNSKNKFITAKNVKSLVNTIVIPSISSTPLESLHRGNWPKLICGDAVDIRNLSLVYTLAGFDCIDCAADASFVSAVNEGIEAAKDIVCLRRPWVMISVNDDKDLHFRKAEFDPEDCPADCSRPCENVCPANAITFQGKSTSGISHNTEAPRVLKVQQCSIGLKMQDGVITESCYGCGRCLPVCPYNKIREVTYARDAITTAALIKRNCVDAMEIHTSGSDSSIDSKELWSALGDSVVYLKLIAVSASWHLSEEFILEIIRVSLPNGGFLHTIDGLKKEGLFQTTTEYLHDNMPTISSCDSSHALISGIAYGGYARKPTHNLYPIIYSIGIHAIEDHPEHLLMALKEALALLGPIKCL
uniref:4Fe-4S ferredoxin-type domain-containing protein n=1 Tax=Glycine max TaxID=3847 RepID=A0A0R0G0N7_SOYBN